MGIEIITGPFEVWMAPVDEAFPDMADAPAGNWALIGTNGSRHHTEDGVVISSNQNVEEHFGAGGTEVMKLSRTQERLMVVFTLFDLVAGEFVKAFNLATTTTDTAAGSGTAGHQSFPLLRGLGITSKAIIIRGPSPLLATEILQFEVPEVAQVADLEMVASKADKMGLLFNLQAIGNYTYSTPYGKAFIGDEAAL